MSICTFFRSVISQMLCINNTSFLVLLGLQKSPTQERKYAALLQFFYFSIPSRSDFIIIYVFTKTHTSAASSGVLLSLNIYLIQYLTFQLYVSATFFFYKIQHIHFKPLSVLRNTFYFKQSYVLFSFNGHPNKNQETTHFLKILNVIF